ncbi:MAG: diaminopimelate epimerase [Proteobacteria bacterium]|nr:diaminopimelate epimerase [Pseudomonadota bacterium]
MRVRFTKMQGCGNDFVVFDARARAPVLSPARAAAVADRRRGIGCDQVIALEPAGQGADVVMRIRNPDGSEAGACGNATRCVAFLLARETGRRDFVIRTVAGDLPARVLDDGQVRVDMGAPRLDWADIPLSRPMDTLHLPLGAGHLPLGAGHLPLGAGHLPLAAGPAADPAAASMGNPHATFFVADLAAVPVAAIGPVLEQDPLFPDRANIGFAQVLAPDRLRLRVWERGAGLTLACGSGACAALVNAHRRGLVGRAATVELDGGALHIAWRAEDGHVLMTGPAAIAFTGEVELAAAPS